MLEGLSPASDARKVKAGFDTPTVNAENEGDESGKNTTADFE
jgi:hypothetical protein